MNESLLALGGWKFFITGLLMMLGIGLYFQHRYGENLELLPFHLPLNHILLFRVMMVMAAALIVAGALTTD